MRETRKKNASDRQKAIEKLGEAKRSGLKRTEQFEEEIEHFDEEEYQLLEREAKQNTKKRARKAGGTTAAKKESKPSQSVTSMLLAAGAKKKAEVPVGIDALAPSAKRQRTISAASSNNSSANSSIKSVFDTLDADPLGDDDDDEDDEYNNNNNVAAANDDADDDDGNEEADESSSATDAVAEESTSAADDKTKSTAVSEKSKKTTPLLKNNMQSKREHVPKASSATTVTSSSTSATAPVPVTETSAASKKAIAAPLPVLENVAPLITPASSSAATFGGNKLRIPYNSDGSLDMYWIDAYEDPYKQPGIVYLFGKVFCPDVKAHVSCCIKVTNIERCMYILPKTPPITDEEKISAHSELMELTEGIPERKVKFVKRRYAFEEPGIPREETIYLKLKYSANYQPITIDADQSTHFQHVFGAKQSFLEQLLIKRKIMGPCWLNIKSATVNKVDISWCKMELTVENYKNVAVLQKQNNAPLPPAPPLTALSLKLKTVYNEHKKSNEIVMASALVHTNVQVDGPTDETGLQVFSAFRKVDGMALPEEFTNGTAPQNLEVCLSEAALLNYLLARLHTIDPDILIGHNFIGFDLDVLLHRMKANNSTHWSRLGRLRRSYMPRLQSGAGGMGDATSEEKKVVSGRLVCDTYLGAKEHLREKSYSLRELAINHLDFKKQDIDSDMNTIKQYYKSATGIRRLAMYCESDAQLCMRLMFKLELVPLSKQLSCLAGNLWSRTLSGGRAERIEYLLLHEFHNRKFILPDKTYGDKSKPQQQQQQQQQQQSGKRVKKEVSDADVDFDAENEVSAAVDVKHDPNARRAVGGRRKPAYAGGLVFEPKKGLYDKIVLLLDFNSLYPSIIQEFNICFTTVERPMRRSDGTFEEAQVPPSTHPMYNKSVLPAVIRELVERRKQVKELLKKAKDPLQQQQYDIRQKAIKLTANSMYGCLGFGFSRFYCQPMAELITRKGRNTLEDTKNDVENVIGKPVIYGDTDSVMVLTQEDDFARAREIGNAIKQHINKKYRHLEIDIDAMFSRILLLKKKKYAAVTVTEDPSRPGSYIYKTENKGLDLVRRDWCELSHDVSQYCLDQVLSGKTSEEVVDAIHSHLRDVAYNVKNGLVDMGKFVITKGLTKDPELYPDLHAQPHVQVALQLKKKNKVVKAGDRIPYVISNVPSNIIAEKARSPDDVTVKASKESSSDQPTLEIDAEWYLGQQVHPPVSRLCEHIQGTDSALLAECLGLDKAKYQPRYSNHLGSEDDPCTVMSSLIDDDEERYSKVDKLQLKCSNCNRDVQIDIVKAIFDAAESLITDNNPDENSKVKLLVCNVCKHDLKPANVMNTLQRSIREQQQKYYNNRVVQTSGKPNTSGIRHTRQICMRDRHAIMNGRYVGAAQEFTAEDLQLHLKYYESLFDWNLAKEKARKKVMEKFGTGQKVTIPNAEKYVERVVAETQRENADTLATVHALNGKVKAYLNSCARRWISLDNLFSFMGALKITQST